MLPTPQLFAEEVGKLGVSERDHVVIYDANGILTASRVYWTFKVFGHERASVLNGGLAKWVKEGRPVASGVETVEPVQYAAPQVKESILEQYDAVLANALVAQKDPKSAIQVVDSRPNACFIGTAPPLRPNLPVGHIPGSTSIPFFDLVQDGELISDEKLRSTFAEHGIDVSKKVITTCGAGIAASVAYLALERAGAVNASLYDGSWHEYASIETSPIVAE